MFRTWLARLALAGALLMVGIVLSLIAAYLVLVIDRTDRRDADGRAAMASEAALQRPLVSRTGRILFVAQHDATDDFYVVNVDGSGLTRLTHLRRGWNHSSPPVVSPDGTRLALSVGFSEISVIRLDRPGETSRLDRPGGWLAWSPDGAWLASLSIDDEKRLHLHVFNADGSGDVRDIARAWPSTAAGHRQFVGDLVWSPDAIRFAFVLRTRPAYRRTGPKHSHLYVVNADGTGLRNMSLKPGGLPVGGGLSWSPDGRQLAFEGGRGIGTVDSNLTWTEVPVWPHATRASQQPVWSPDGARLAWFNPDSIVLSNIDGLHQQEVTRGRCPGIHPSWSDDGRRIAFVCEDPCHFRNVFVMNADGSGLTQVTHLGEGESWIVATAHYSPHHPVWLPPPRPNMSR
jgi:Tol biopolymer transport system component